MDEFGRDLWRFSCLISLVKQGHLKLVLQGQVQEAFEYLPDQPVPVSSQCPVKKCLLMFRWHLLFFSCTHCACWHYPNHTLTQIFSLSVNRVTRAVILGIELFSQGTNSSFLDALNSETHLLTKMTKKLKICRMGHYPNPPHFTW